MSEPMKSVSAMNKLYIGNLPIEADEAAVRQLFAEQNLTVADISVKRGGYAFVDFPDQSAADRAIDKLHGYSYCGLPLIVEPSVANKKITNVPNLQSASTTQLKEGNSESLPGGWSKWDNVDSMMAVAKRPAGLYTSQHTTCAPWRQRRCRGDAQAGRGSRSPSLPPPVDRRPTDESLRTDDRTKGATYARSRAHSAQYSLHARTGLFRVPLFHIVNVAQRSSSRSRYPTAVLRNMDGDLSQGASGDVSPIYDDG
ncbi:unnamed protein product [Chrysodeixis includens]|uniref:RRM domain-containing protein n=1 Tax=Chrysodeixis includens TaxID=689277 RepID=A0A9N8KWZ7_CHRIL|nr:unnamed protein product [Chrysodeixis includens]